VAQRAAPQSRIVYVDHDPMVLARARTLLTSTPEGAAVYINADMREPDRILEQAAQTFDLAQPIALLFMGCLGHIADDDEAQSIVRRLVDGLSSGSYLVIIDGVDVVPDDLARAQRNYDEGGSIPYVIRNADQVRRFFDGVELLEPGLVPAPQWRPEAAPVDPLPETQPFGGVGRKP
jgi:S-adenosyl methyltransferase